MIKNLHEEIEKVEKIDLNLLIKDYQIKDEQVFGDYLEKIWMDLSSRSKEVVGIDKLTFGQYYNLPGIINDRLFNLFDSNNNEFLSQNDFVRGMKTLFTSKFETLALFIFKLYDFNKDNFITKEDVRVVLSYVPLQKKYSKDKMKYEQNELGDRIESQNELDEILNRAFGKKTKIDEKEFVKIIDDVSSDIFIYILMFLLEKRPFSDSTIEVFKNSNNDNSKNDKDKTKVENKAPGHYVASPTLKSKLASPSLKKRASVVKKPNSDSKPNILNLFATNQSGKTIETTQKFKQKEQGKESNLKKLYPKKRAVKKNFSNLEEVPKANPIVSVTNSKIEKENLIYEDYEESEPPLITHNGYLYKSTHSKKLQKKFFKLIGKDIFYFKSKDDKLHEGMHNLSGVFIKDYKSIDIEGVKYFAFAIVYPKKERAYFCTKEQDYKEWIEKLKLAVENNSFDDQYALGSVVGKGKFGLVRLGTHISSGRKVAIKIMSKNEMSTQDLELARTEIDVLKVCQHPNIIKLYDVFENENQIFIVMEYCPGGDLFSYIEARGFKLSEERTATIIHKLSMAVYYLHSYGIVHRDLKPENILMTSLDNDADIRLLDFGLSKIIGPNEKCTEPYGTLSYVAPEVLLEKPYGKEVDLWTIGIITFLLLCGYLPFDDEKSEKEIARKTIKEEVVYEKRDWCNFSEEAMLFVDGLLQKNPKERMTISQVLEHNWFKKFTKAPMKRLASKKSGGGLFNLYVSDD